MRVIYQLWGIPGRHKDWDRFLERLDILQDRYPAKTLVCGIDAPEYVYRRIMDRAARDGAELYLWLPVFSELDGLACFDPLVDWRGERFLENADLRFFRFRCPGSGRNREAVFEDSLHRLEAADFSGVFLDRIRYPSFQFGLPGVLGCFCPGCVERYRKMGLDPDALREACAGLSRRIAAGEPDPLGLEGFDGCRWTFRDPALQALFDARCAILSESLSELTAAYRARGCKIGLDLFTPALGYFTGQDFGRMARIADFVKPMMYLHTDAPAGLPYELEAVAQAAGPQSRRDLMHLSGGETVDAFASAEIRRMMDFSRRMSDPVPVFFGTEYNRVRDIAPVGPAEIGHSLRVFRAAGADGLMPSWDLLSAPDENVYALLDALQNRITGET